MEFLINMKFYMVPLITIVIIWQDTLKIYSKSIPIVGDWKKKKKPAHLSLMQRREK